MMLSERVAAGESAQELREDIAQALLDFEAAPKIPIHDVDGYIKALTPPADRK
jgi:hypothetical protein